MSDSTNAPKEPRAHARIPAPILWIQDHLLLGLLMAGSGVINARFLVYGLVPNIDDPGSWGFINTVEIGALACAGIALGGLEVRISYKLGECIAKSAWGRALFLMFGITVLAFIEFWASYSQRSQNIPTTAADHAFLTLLNLGNSGLNITAICISIAIPFLSVFWGFAAEDPAPAIVEDPATVKARMENDLLQAEYKAKIRAAQAQGIRAAAMGAMGRPATPNPAENAPAFAEQNTGETPNVTPGNPPSEPKGFRVEGQRGLWWDAPAFQGYILFQYQRGISPNKAMEIVRRIGNDLKGKRAGSPGAAPYVAQVSKLKTEAKSLFGDEGNPADLRDDSPSMSGVFSPETAE